MCRILFRWTMIPCVPAIVSLGEHFPPHCFQRVGPVEPGPPISGGCQFGYVSPHALDGDRPYSCLIDFDRDRGAVEPHEFIDYFLDGHVGARADVVHLARAASIEQRVQRGDNIAYVGEIPPWRGQANAEAIRFAPAHIGELPNERHRNQRLRLSGSHYVEHASEDNVKPQRARGAGGDVVLRHLAQCVGRQGRQGLCFGYRQVFGSDGTVRGGRADLNYSRGRVELRPGQCAVEIVRSDGIDRQVVA